MEKRMGFVGIIIKERESSAKLVNEVLSAYGASIIVRTGLPYREKECCVITLIVDMSTDDLGAMTGKLGVIKGVSVKSALANGG